VETLLANLAPVHHSQRERTDYSARMETLLFPLGLGLIASVLKSHACSFSTYDSYTGGSLRGFLELVERRRPAVLMMSGFLGNQPYPFVESVSKRVEACQGKVAIDLHHSRRPYGHDDPPSPGPTHARW